MLFHDYINQVQSVLSYVSRTQLDKINDSAKIVSDCFSEDGILYVFGCGHSHIIGEDLFYRAGGVASVCAMLDGDLMLHEGAVKSSYYERMPGLAKPVFDRYGIARKDVLLISSTSGINSVPVEMAMHAKEAGVCVIAIVADAYAQDESRHPSGKRLRDVADIVIDNGVCHGDAAVEVGNSGMRVGPISTISGCMIAQSIIVQAVENLWNSGLTPPVFVSGNIEGGMERNQGLINKYMPRIRHL